MSSEFGSDIVTISDEEGNDFVLEHLDTLELGDTYYMAFLPADMDESDDDYGLVILKVIEEDGEDVLVSVDDDDLLNKLYDLFVDRLLDENDA